MIVADARGYKANPPCEGAPLHGSRFSVKSRDTKHILMIDVLNLALPYFGLIFDKGYACGEYKNFSRKWAWNG